MLVAAPAQERVDDQRVLHVDQHADRRVDRATAPRRRARSGRSVAPAPPYCSGISMPMTPSVEQLLRSGPSASWRARPSRGRAAGSRVGELGTRCRGAAVRPRSRLVRAGRRVGVLARCGTVELPVAGVADALDVGSEPSPDVIIEPWADFLRVRASRQPGGAIGLAARRRRSTPAAGGAAGAAAATPPAARQGSRQSRADAAGPGPASSGRRSSAPASTPSASTSSSPTRTATRSPI